MDTHLNLATVWETIADTIGDRPALVHGETRITWSSFDDRASRVAAHLGRSGVGPDDNVALYLYNCPEYLESTFASFKVRAATVNVNYRYLEGELEYLFVNSEAKAVVFHSDFAGRLDAIRDRLGNVRAFICVRSHPDDAVPDWADDYDDVISTASPIERVERSDQDRWILYTGGTTGSPKGVIWPHASLLATAAATFAIVKAAVPGSVADVRTIISEFLQRSKFVTLLPAAPLMHGTSAITALGVLSSGGTVVTLESRSFDANELWHAVELNLVTQLTIVGDAFGQPMLQALREADASGKPFDISSLKVVLSSGVMWSRNSKEALHEWTPATFADSLGSSEGVGFATSVSRQGSPARTARFALGPNAAVFDEHGERVAAGSGQRGLLAVSGAIPVGYYNDPDKTAQTFRHYEGRVWSVPGDFATVEADGTINLLGRGSACINTAGEKVYPEEVEETLKLHPKVRDANVVGVPDDKWGSAVHGVVSLQSGQLGSSAGQASNGLPDGEVLEAELISHCRDHLAGYKCPKRVHIVAEVQRGPNGKPDYRWASEVAQSR